MSWQDGRAWLTPCTRCDELVVLAHCEGIKLILSRHAVPLKDAMVLGKYSRILINLWVGTTQIYASAWYPSYGRPSRGRIYAEHLCDVRP